MADVFSNPAFATEGTFTPDNLSAGDFPVATDTVTLKSGDGAHVRGTVLGKITATGKYITSLAAAVDGSQVPAVILLQDADSTAADVLAPVALTGEFNLNALTLGAGHTTASIKDGLRALSIFLKNVVRAG